MSTSMTEFWCEIERRDAVTPRPVRPSSLSPIIGTSPRSAGIGRRLAEKRTDSVHYLDGGVYDDHAAGDT